MRPPNAGKGRPKGSKNKKTKEIGELADECIARPDYKAKLFARIDKGKAPHMELFFWQHRYGKPKDTTEVTGANGQPLIIGWLKGDA
jgi:hypothetical protein